MRARTYYFTTICSYSLHVHVQESKYGLLFMEKHAKISARMEIRIVVILEQRSLAVHTTQRYDDICDDSSNFCCL